MWDTDRICHDCLHHVIEVSFSIDCVNSLYIILWLIYKYLGYIASNGKIIINGRLRRKREYLLWKKITKTFGIPTAQYLT